MRKNSPLIRFPQCCRCHWPTFPDSFFSARSSTCTCPSGSPSAGLCPSRSRSTPCNRAGCLRPCAGRLDVQSTSASPASELISKPDKTHEQFRHIFEAVPVYFHRCIKALSVLWRNTCIHVWTTSTQQQDSNDCFIKCNNALFATSTVRPRLDSAGLFINFTQNHYHLMLPKLEKFGFRFFKDDFVIR